MADGYDFFGNFACVDSYFVFVLLCKTVSNDVVEDAVEDVTRDTAEDTDEGV